MRWIETDVVTTFDDGRTAEHVDVAVETSTVWVTLVDRQKRSYRHGVPGGRREITLRTCECCGEPSTFCGCAGPARFEW